MVRDSFGDPRGALVVVDLARASPEEVAGDPVCAAAWTHAQRTRPPEPGEKVLLYRSVTDRDHHHHRASATQGMASVLMSQQPALDPSLGWSLIALGAPELWREVNLFTGFAPAGPAVTSGDFEVHLYAHDFATVPFERWVGQLIARVVEAYLNPDGHTPPPAVVALSFEEFTAAVKDGLRHLHEPHRLARNPLAQSGLVSGGTGLADVLAEAIDELASDPRTEKLHRALQRTYVRPAATQELAAEVLGLPFSTYRRHLSTGIERVTATLWHRELHGK